MDLKYSLVGSSPSPSAKELKSPTCLTKKPDRVAANQNRHKTMPVGSGVGDNLTYILRHSGMNGHQVGGRGLVLYASPEGDVMGRAAIEPSTKVGATVSNPPIQLSNKFQLP